MNAKEASELTNIIKPNLVIPVHYNDIVGSKEDEKVFLENLDKEIEYKLYL
jgi:L-ascorbate metabolism protein UlaG (beta-lactamase superfamily)